MKQILRKAGSVISYPFRKLGKAIAWLFKPTPRGRVRWMVAGLLLLGIAAGFFSYPKPFDAAADAVNGAARANQYTSWIHVPHFGSIPVKLGLDLQGGTHLLYEADMTAIPAADRNDALSGVRDVIERRVNAFGVAEPLIQTNRVGDHYRIIAELAGVKDVNQAIKMIGETPTLDFRERTDDGTGAVAPPVTLEYTEQSAEIDAFNAEVKKKAEGILARALKGENFYKLAADNGEDASKAGGGDLGWFAKDTHGKEIDAVVWNMKLNQVYAKLVPVDTGYFIVKKTGYRIFNKIPQVRASVIFFKTKLPVDANDPSVVYPGWKQSALSGKQLKSARVQFDQQTGEPTVLLTFNDEGDKLFAEITERNVGKQVGIFLDGHPISAPVVQQKISGGTAVVSGNFTIEEAKLLSRRLNAGALPVPIKLVSQQTVDATLGGYSLDRSLMAGLIGFAAVVLFMLIFYRLPGLIASVALLIYAGVSVAIFKIVGITLTLAGIAGFILSIGMAVDANILIFERVKEELNRGRSLSDALSEGFKRAWNSIRDSNASSLITCAILIWFGTSTVRGFAITLAIGVIVSMFSAITTTRIFLKFVMRQTHERRLWLYGRIKKTA